MTLVDYSSSSSESESSSPNRPAKRPRCEGPTKDHSSLLPPLPESFRNVYSSAARVSTRDDPALHQGRKRAVPHVKGNWPSHIYLEWMPSPEHASLLQELVDAASSSGDPVSTKTLDVKSLVFSDLGVPRPLHISLSCPLVLRTEQRATFLDLVKEQVKELQSKGGANISVGLDSLVWAANFEETRWFLALCVDQPGQVYLADLLESCNAVAADMGLPQLYVNSKPNAVSEISSENSADAGDTVAKSPPKSERFHFSIAWTLQPTTRKNGKVANANADPMLMQKARKLSLTIDTVKVKIGNTVHSLSLQGKKN